MPLSSRTRICGELPFDHIQDRVFVETAHLAPTPLPSIIPILPQFARLSVFLGLKRDIMGERELTMAKRRVSVEQVDYPYLLQYFVSYRGDYK